MRIIFFLSILGVMLLGCKSETPKSKTEFQVDTKSTIRSYMRWGEQEAFMKEYGRINRWVNQEDSIQIEYCKDSVFYFKDNVVGNTIKKTVCFPDKELFVKGEFKINPDQHKAGPMFRRNELKNVFKYKILGKDYDVYKMESIYTKDMKGDTVILHSTEYWNDQLGIILKVDENFIRKRRRKIETSFVQDLDKPLKAILKDIRLDTTSWITLNDEGKPWF